MSHSHKTGVRVPVNVSQCDCPCLQAQKYLELKDTAAAMHVCLSARKWVKVKHMYRILWAQHKMVSVCARKKEWIEGGRDKEGKLKGNDE